MKINVIQHYSWRASYQNVEVVDVSLQSKRDGAAAKVFFKRFLRFLGEEPSKIVTGNLRSCGVEHQALIPAAVDGTFPYSNNRAEQSHEAIRVRERGLRRFKSIAQTQRFVTADAAVKNLFRARTYSVPNIIGISGSLRSPNEAVRILEFESQFPTA